MPFVERNGGGKIKGLYAVAQTGYADEYLADDNAEVVSYRAPLPSPTLDELYDQAILNQRVLKAVILALNDGTLPIGTNKTAVQLKAIIKAKM